MRQHQIELLATLAIMSLFVWAIVPERAAAAPISIAKVEERKVDFEKDILPFLRNSCIACHNTTEAESELILETPQSILKGGDQGPSVVPGESSESLMLKFASHQDEDFIMPPEENDRSAPNLTPEQLGLLKLWIDQGATGAVTGSNLPIQWQPLPTRVHPILAVTLTEDGQYVACGRGNRIYVYQTQTGKLVTRLTDPDLQVPGADSQPGVAHVDMVQSLSFSPEGNVLASGSFRTVKLWCRARNVRSWSFENSLSKNARAIAVSADAKWFAAANSDNGILLWDLSTGKPSRPLTGHTNTITALEFSANNEKIVSSSLDGTIRLWQTDSGQTIAEGAGESPILAVTMNVDSNRIYAGHPDGKITIWELKDQKLQSENELTGHSKPITSLAVIPSQNDQLLSGSEDGTVRHWDLAKAKQLRAMKHGGPVTSVAVRPDGSRFGSASSDHTAKLWDASSGKQLAEMKGNLKDRTLVAKRQRESNVANSLAGSAKKSLEEVEKSLPPKQEASKKAAQAKVKAQKEYDEKLAPAKVAKESEAALEKRIMELAEAVKMATAAKTAAEKAATKAAAEAKAATEAAAEAEKKAAADAKNESLAKAARSAKKNALVQILEKAKKETDKAAAELAVFEIESKATEAAEELPEAKKNAEEAAKALADAEAKKKNAERLDSLAANDVKRITEAIPKAKVVLAAAEVKRKEADESLKAAKEADVRNTKPLRVISFSPDNLQLAISGDDKVVHLHHAGNGEAIDVYEGQTGPVLSLAFLASGDLVSGSADKSVMIWDRSTPWMLERTIGSIDDPDIFGDRVTSLDFAPDGRLLATGGGEPSRSGEVKLWNLADGSLVREISEPHSDVVGGLEFSPDGKYLATGACDKFVKIFEVETGKFIRAFEGHSHHVLDVGWKADGKTLVSSGADSVVKVWNSETGEQQRRSITGFEKQVTSVQFVGDSNNVLCCSGDKIVAIKRADNGANVRTFGGTTDFMYSAAATPDGKIVVAGGYDGLLRIWDGTNGKVLRNLGPPDTQEILGESQQASK